jgi:signal transduction histidine kinase
VAGTQLQSSPPRGPGRTARGAALAAVGVAVVSAGLCVGAVALLWLAPARHPYGYDISGDLVVGGLFPLAGALVAVRAPGNRCSWVLLSAGSVAVSAFSHEWAYDGLARPGLLPFVPAATWLAAWTFVPYWAQITLLPVLFPDGAIPSRRWRRFVVAVLVVIAVVTVVAMFRPDPDVEGLGVRNPLGIGPAHVGNGWHFLLLGPVLALALGAAPVALVALIARQRRAVGRVRSQLQWLLLGFVSCLVIVVVTTVVPLPWGRGGHYGLAVAFAMVPVAVAVAVLRHGLFDVELVVNRAIVYAALTALGLAAYAGLLALIGTGTGRGTYAPLLAALIAAVLTAARSGFQRFVDRKLFGARRDPYEVVRRVGVSVAAADNPGEALASLVATVCEVLALPYAAVEPAGPAGDVGRAEWGSPVPWAEALPAVYRGRQVGVLRVGHRHRGERFRPEEASALGDVAHRAATLLHAAGLSADLQASRERVVVAREEERRRLRRDLHDGLGPELAGMALQLDSLASGLRGDAALAERALGLRDRMRHTVTEVRRIVEGLRPSAVDELGLAEALRQLAVAESDLEFDVRVPAAFGELPAAVEVAAYRITAEACANVFRHARASRCAIDAGIDAGWLTLTVADNGAGFGAEAAVGVGLRSLHERAAEVGGSVEIRSAPGGTTVCARLPVEAG